MDLPRTEIIFEIDHDGQRAVMPLRGDWRRAALWFVWALGLGLFHFFEFFSQDDRLMQIIVSAGFVITAIAGVAEAMFTFLGREILSVQNRQITYTWRSLGVKRHRAFAIDRIEALTVNSAIIHATVSNEIQPHQPVSPFLDFGKRGRLKLDYDEGSFYFGAAISDEDARRLVAWLTPHLPDETILEEAAPSRFSQLR